MTEFQWPWEYTFPPFFTLQLHEETRKQQLTVWADLFLKFLKHSNRNVININDNSIELYQNATINRRLSADFVSRILEELQHTGHAQPVDKRCTEWLVYWHTLEEYGNMIYEWIQETGQLNTICTLYELSAGENSEQTEFHGVDETVLLKALRTLETEKGKCEVIDMDGSYGVKFF